VSNFLKKFKYDNAVTQDLWNSLQEVWTGNDGLDVGLVMATWTKQMGYPVVSVKKVVGQQGKYELTQKRFLADADAVAPDDSPFQ
jgi:aminopeptidase N